MSTVLVEWRCPVGQGGKRPCRRVVATVELEGGRRLLRWSGSGMVVRGNGTVTYDGPIDVERLGDSTAIIAHEGKAHSAAITADDVRDALRRHDAGNGARLSLLTAPKR